MFGFIRPHQQDLKTAVPAVQPAGVLVSKEDIYRVQRGMEPILLLRKGLEVSSEDLPRLIKNGARPHQFHFREAGAVDETAGMDVSEAHPAATFRRPDAETLSGKLNRAANQHKTAIILEPEPKNMKRLIDCLFVCGLSLNRIHPVRIADHLTWSLEKYRPQVLMADYQLPGGLSGLEVLVAVRALSCLESAILIIPPENTLLDSEKRLIRETCRENGIRLLARPVNRFALSRILSGEKAPATA